jgi:hypothetical protein
MLPMFICEKKAALDPESIVDHLGENILEWMKNDPQIKMVMSGNLLEMVEKGLLEM